MTNVSSSGSSWAMSSRLAEDLFSRGDVVTISTGDATGDRMLWTVVAFLPFDMVHVSSIEDKEFIIPVHYTQMHQTKMMPYIFRPVEVYDNHMGPTPLEPRHMLKQKVGSFNNQLEACIIDATDGKDSAWDPRPFLDQWIPLRLLGGNYIMIKKREEAAPPLLMFPRLNAMGLELWFHSNWIGMTVLIIEVDGLKKCPQNQLWPYCRWCRKFHLPYEGSFSHRASKQHQRFRKYYLSPALADPTGESLKKLRHECMTWSSDTWM